MSLKRREAGASFVAGRGTGPPAGAGPAGAPAGGSAAHGREMRNLGRHTLIYGAGIVASKLASFIMLPVYTRYLTPADYGVLELLSMTIDVIGTVAGIGLSASIFKFYADFQPKGEEKQIISTAGIAALAIACVTAGLGLLFSPMLSRAVFDHGIGSDPLYFRLFFLIYLVQTAEMVPLLLLRARHESVAFVAASVGKLVAMLTMNIIFVVVLRMGVLGVLISNLAVSAVSATALTSYAIWRTGPHFSRQKFMMMARFGYPMVFWLLSNFVLVFSDRYFLNHYSGPAVVGIYSLAYKFAFVLTAFAFTPFQMVWEPQRFALARGERASEIYARVFTYLNVALGGMALVMALYVMDLLRVMAAPAFLPAYRLVPLILAAQVIYHWTAFCNVGLFLRDKTRVLARLSVVAVVAVLALNILLIPRFGVWGAAVATLGGYGVRFLAVFIPAQRAFRVHYDWRTVGRLYLILGAALAARLSVGLMTIAPSVAFSTVLALAAGFAVYRTVLTASDRMWIRSKLMRSRTELAAADAGD